MTPSEYPLPDNEKKRLTEENGSSWRDYKMYLLNNIELINEELKVGRKDRTEIKINLATMQEKTKQHAGYIASAVAVVVSVVTAFVVRLIK